MPYGKPKGAVSTHAQAGDGAAVALRPDGVVGIDIGDELRGYKGFVFGGRVAGAIPIPTVLPIGTDEHDAGPVGYGGQIDLS